MKFAATTYSFMQYIRQEKMTQFDCIAKAKELGFDAIDFTELIVPEGCTKEEYAQRLHDEAERVGIELSAYTIGANLLKGEEEVERLKKELDIAAILGVKLFRHDATFQFVGERSQRGYFSVVDEMAERARAITEYARTLGIKTMTENHGYLAQDSLRVEALINKVADPNYGWLVDIGNFMCADEDPAKAVGVAAPYAFHVHAKDFILKSGNEPNPGQGFFRSRAGNYLRGTIVGHGAVPVYQCLQNLKRNGYDGFVAIEFEGMEDCIESMKIGLENVKRYLAE